MPPSRRAAHMARARAPTYLRVACRSLRTCRLRALAPRWAVSPTALPTPREEEQLTLTRSTSTTSTLVRKRILRYRSSPKWLAMVRAASIT